MRRGPIVRKPKSLMRSAAACALLRRHASACVACPLTQPATRSDRCCQKRSATASWSCTWATSRTMSWLPSCSTAARRVHPAFGQAQTYAASVGSLCAWLARLEETFFPRMIDADSKKADRASPLERFNLASISDRTSPQPAAHRFLGSAPLILCSDACAAGGCAREVRKHSFPE